MCNVSSRDQAESAAVLAESRGDRSFSPLCPKSHAKCTTFSFLASCFIKPEIVGQAARLPFFSPRRSLSDYAKALRRDGERRSAGRTATGPVALQNPWFRLRRVRGFRNGATHSLRGFLHAQQSGFIFLARLRSRRRNSMSQQQWRMQRTNAW